MDSRFHENNMHLYIKTLIFLLIISQFSYLSPALAQTARKDGDRQVLYSAEITWNTDKPSTSQVEYGEGLEGGYSNITGIDTNLVTSHKVIINNLKPDVIYHYRVRSKDSDGREMIGKDFTIMISGGKVAQAIEISDVKAGNIIAAGPADPAKDSAATDEREEKDKKRSASMATKEEPIEKSLIERGGLLLSRGQLQIEPSFTYAHVSANRIAVHGFAIFPILVIGEISTENVKKDIFIGAASARYGILDNLQWNVKVPYRYQFDRISQSNVSETTRSANDLGDIESGLFYQLLYEKGAWPGLIAGVNVKSDTGGSPYGKDVGIGTGHWSVKPSLVWVKSTDPAILFGSFSYGWNIKRDISGFGDVDPGDSFEYSAGLAFALNYQTAINFQLEQQITPSLKMNGKDVAGSFTNVANFKTGLTHSISKNLSIDVVGAYGMTDDAPDFTLEVRLPYTF